MLWCGLLAFGTVAPGTAPAQGSRPTSEPGSEPRARRSPEENAVRACLDYFARIATTTEYRGFGEARGWASRYTLDLKLRHGHAGQPVPRDVVCLKNPGTVTLGRLYLLAHRILKEPAYLEYARQVGQLLLAAQTEPGGWGKELWMGRLQVNTIRTGSGIRRWPASDPPDTVRGDDSADLDEANTAEAMEFLYQLWWVTRDDRFLQAYYKALDFHLRAQEAAGGGFPETYPASSYRSWASFGGETTLNAVRSLQLGYERTGRREYLEAIIRCADWLLSVRKPGQGWAMRYDRQGRPVAGRAFEPPGLCTESTLFAITTLAIAHRYTADQKYLHALRDAADWLRRLPATQGVYARFYHPDSDTAWFMDGVGREVPGPRKARKDYAWLGRWGKMGIDLAERTARLKVTQPRRVPPGGDPSVQAQVLLPRDIPALTRKGITVEKLLASQTAEGTWPVDAEGLEMVTVGATAARLRLLLGEIVKKASTRPGSQTPP